MNLNSSAHNLKNLYTKYEHYSSDGLWLMNLNSLFMSNELEF